MTKKTVHKELDEQHGTCHYGQFNRKYVYPTDQELADRFQQEMDEIVLYPSDERFMVGPSPATGANPQWVIVDEIEQAASGSSSVSSGGNNDYYLVPVPSPKRLEPYTAECEDIIEALDMSFPEGEAFKALWRKCAARLGMEKAGNTALRDAQKVQHFGNRMVAIETKKLT